MEKCEIIELEKIANRVGKIIRHKKDELRKLRVIQTTLVELIHYDGDYLDLAPPKWGPMLCIKNSYFDKLFCDEPGKKSKKNNEKKRNNS